jgi:hypothetical protein
MSNPDFIHLAKKNYRLAIEAVVGTQMFRSIWVYDTASQREFDALQNGVDSCAYVVSGILALHNLIDKPHATVPKTIDRMLQHGWRKTDQPIHGDVIHWPAHNGNEHVGFYVDSNTCVSNNSDLRTPIKHHLRLRDGRVPDAFYTHDIMHSAKPYN